LGACDATRAADARLIQREIAKNPNWPEEGNEAAAPEPDDGLDIPGFLKRDTKAGAA
jgi:hypothetical protein